MRWVVDNASLHRQVSNVQLAAGRRHVDAAPADDQVVNRLVKPIQFEYARTIHGYRAADGELSIC